MDEVSDLLVGQLVKAGVQTVFGLPGGENVPLMEALRRAGLRFVLVRHESSAVFMADVTARLTGTPGVCLTTLGPGAANAVAGVAHAYLDRAPVLIITACLDNALLPIHTHQSIDLGRLFAPITKGSFTLTPANVHDIVPTALALCRAGRPGPVHVQVSRQVAESPVQSGATPPLPAPVNLAPAPDEWQKARALLTAAERPLIIAGLGLAPGRSYEALRAFAESVRAPVILTPKVKGALPADHPLYAGTIGLTREDPVYELVKEADCLVAVGFDVVELVKPWQEEAPLIWLASWTNADPKIPASVELVAPLSRSLGELARALPSQTSSSSPANGWGQYRVSRLHETQAERPVPAPMAGRMRPQEVLNGLRAGVPRSTLVATDVGSHKILTCLEWPALTPNRFMVSNGLSCMGFGLPAAIAASLALGGQPTVAIVGDGGLAMAAGELQLIRELKTPVIVLVMHDGALDLIRSAQRRAGNELFGVTFTVPDLMMLAKAHELPGRRVSSGEGVTAAVREAIAAGRPALIEALIDPRSYPTTPN